MFYQDLSATINDFLRAMPAEFRYEVLRSNLLEKEAIDEDLIPYRIDVLANEAGDIKVANLAWNKLFH